MEINEIYTHLLPEISNAFKKVEKQETRFAHYTSAENAQKILEGEAIWMRDVGCMNDFDEIYAGLDVIFKTFGKDSKLGDRFWNLIDKIEPNLSEKIKDNFDNWQHDLKTNTFITCLSEHKKNEDKLGRLSMWRAYASPNGVALIIKGKRLYQEESPHGAFTLPMLYKSDGQLKNMFKKLIDRFEIISKEFDSTQLTPELVSSMVLHILKIYALAIKNIGFGEEREWRIIYRPSEQLLEHKIIQPQDTCINGVVQKIYAMPLKNDESKQMEGMGIPDLLDRVIIGPTDYPLQMKKAFIGILERANIENAQDKVFISNIPLRV